MSLPSVLPRRHFLSWDQPWLRQVVAWLAAEWEGAGPLDLAGLLVIVPTKQSGRRLREALAEYAAHRGGAVFAPRVLTPDTLVGQDPEPDVATRLQALLAWTEVFRELDLDAFRNVFPVDPPVRNFSWALRLAQEFARVQATLAEAGLTLADVPRAAGGEFVEAARWSEMAELGERQAKRLAARGWSEPQAARIAAARRSTTAESVARIAVLGTPDLHPLALMRLAALAQTGTVDVVVFAPREEAGSFDEGGRPLPGAWERRVLALERFDDRVHLCADPAAQASRLATLASRYAGQPDVLGLGVADAEITPLLENELTRAGRAVFNPEGRPRRQEAFFELLTALAALARDPAFDRVEALARCPDFFGYLRARGRDAFSEARWLEGLDELRARHLPADLAAAREFAAGLGRYPEISPGLATMDQLRARLNSGAFATATAEVLRELFDVRQLDLSAESDQRWHETAAAWTALLRECRDAADRFEEIPAADWWDLALRMFGEQRRTDEKPAHALELQGWLELMWEDAPHLAVAGLNDGFVPEAVIEDAFLPASLRQRLGLQTNAARFARDAYVLQAIAACRAANGQLDLLFGKTSAAGDPLRPSRLLLRCADEELPKRIAFLFRSPERTEASLAWTRAWKLRPRAAPPPERVAVTALRRYLQCPFRFYLRHVLGMEAVDPLKSELDAFDFGSLCHGALEQIGRDPLLRDCVDAAVLRAELLQHLDRSVRERYGNLLSLPLLVQVESARQRLSKLAELQAIERAAGWEIVDVERAFELDISGLKVRGKIDRIDRHGESGAVRVLDYKTSDTPVAPAEAHWRAVRPADPTPEWARFEFGGKLRAWGDLQLPLYLRALAAEYPGRIACGYFNLPKAAGETTLALWNDYTLELHASAMACAEAACAAIRRGEFWPPNELIRAERDECAALFHHGVAESIAWPAR